MSTVTIRDGIATITTPTRCTEVHLHATAKMFSEGMGFRPSKTDLLALSAGYLELENRVAELETSLQAALAGEIGKEHAQDMEGARKAISELFQAGYAFMGMYDSGDAPDGDTDQKLRAALDGAGNWLLMDVRACMARQKVLEGGAA